MKDDTDSVSEKQALESRKKFVKEFNDKHENKYMAARSFIHPYALVKLAGAHGSPETVNRLLTYDQFDKRKFYEIDGDQDYAGNYSKNPTTTTLIRWGNESARGKTPYSFQDFVFCKWWNKIENNRLITLRRYAAPVTDNIEFSDYNISKEAPKNNNTDMSASIELSSSYENKTNAETWSGTNSNNPWTPLATACTYFGEGTGNDLSSILSFSAKYRWSQLNQNQNDPFDITSSQNDMGSGLINSDFGAITGGLGIISKWLGFFGEVQNGKTINLDGAPASVPPDPYKEGPYNNRILGPINVITNTYRRDRGLEFHQDGLKITFEYVSRPIAGINNKAVLLDLMSNILILTYSSGTWFGGMWRYRAEQPAVYPWKYGDSMNKLYRGQLLGKDGAVMSLTKHVYNEGRGFLSNFLPDAAKFVSSVFKGAYDTVIGWFTGKQTTMTEGQQSLVDTLSGVAESNVSKALQKVIAAKAMKGVTIPYIKNQRALLTGEPVGDWHLTIGNPLNPIVMIGNLIVKDVRIEWDKELGPDDFPIGFKAVVTLDHGLGRDRDAIESMFNRGFGRIYTLPRRFRSSADGETKVDEYTGGVNTTEGRVKYDEYRATYYGGGTRFIAKVQQSNLKNSGKIYTGGVQQMSSLKPTEVLKIAQANPIYFVNPWQMAMNM